MLTTYNYTIKSWTQRFNNELIDVKKLDIHSSWEPFFNENQKEIDKINDFLNKQENKDNTFPYPDLIYNALNTVPLNEIKVVILGQDPYHNFISDKIPQAMGLSFSIPTGPIGSNIPSSLKNIYKNLYQHKEISFLPKYGNLQLWAYQGCLLLNTALTVYHNKPNSHSNIWKLFTCKLIEYISDNCDNVVFVLWGAPALNKRLLIDEDKHKIIISSHPSGLSYNKPLQQYSAFSEQNHFKLINDYLATKGKEKIMWQIA